MSTKQTSSHRLSEEEYLAKLHELWAARWPEGAKREPYYPFGEIPLTEYLTRWAEQEPDKVAYIFYGNEITYRQLDEASNQFAHLLQQHGVRPGDRVAVFLQNCPQFLIAFYGILKMGAIHVPVNPLFMEYELEYELNDAGAEVLVALDQLMPLVRAVKNRTPLRLVFATSWGDMLPEKPTFRVPDAVYIREEFDDALDFLKELRAMPTTPPDHVADLHAPASLNYTGGTTGMPKGCIHTQYHMIYTAACGLAVSGQSAGGNEDVTMSFLPVFWIAGQLGGVVNPVFTGKTHVLMARWDTVAFMEAIERHKVTATGGVLDSLVEVMEHPDVHKYDLSSLRSVRCSSFVKKLDLEYRRRWRELTGTTLAESGWGMTETHTLDAFTVGMQENDMDLHAEPIFVGLPMPGTEFKICDFETGELKPLGEEGEMCVRSPSIMKGYWNKPEATAEAIRDGWLHTGDIGRIDELGYLHYLGRNKEMLKVRGMSVFPSEVEAMLSKHPAVLGSAVVGRKDEHKGQVPIAFIRLHEEYKGKIEPEEIVAWCRQNMATYKVPEVRFIDEFPMTATGKIKKHVLQERL